jgi:fucose permease
MSAALPVADVSHAAQRRAVWSTRAQFLHLGVVVGAYGAHVPSLVRRYALDERRLAGLMLCTTVGSLIMLFLAGRIIGRLGARRTTVLAGFAFAGALGVMLVLPSAWALIPAMMVLGAGESLFDIAVNAEGTTLELLGGRAIMSGLHAMFSVGAMVGAGMVALLYRWGVAPATQLGAIAVPLAIALTVSSRGMLPVHPSDEREVHFAWPRGLLLMIGLLILAAMMAEGVMYNWSVLYVQQELGAAPERAALAYGTFSGATAVMRFAGDAVRSRWSERQVLVAGALLASLSMVVVLLAATIAVALVGFAFVGMGIATVVPILYNATTRVPGVSRAAALASASSIGYVGFLLGPPIVGSIAHATSLTTALGTLVIACLVLVAGAGRVPLGRPTRAAAPAPVLP